MTRKRAKWPDHASFWMVRTVEAPGKTAQHDSGLSKIQQNASLCAVPSVYPGNVG